MRKIIYKIRDLFHVLRGHYVLISLSKTDLLDLVKDEPCTVNASYNGMREYAAALAVKTVSELWDEDDLALMKATLEAEVELTIMNKN